MTKICIFGAGSIGGYLAACLSKTNIDLSLIARGPHKKAIEENGLTLIKEGRSENFKLKVTDDPKTLDVQDYIFCLLYTSPSPRDATLSRMPSSA